MPQFKAVEFYLDLRDASDADREFVKRLRDAGGLRLVSASTDELKQQLRDDGPSMLPVGATHLKHDVPPAILQQDERVDLRPAAPINFGFEEESRQEGPRIIDGEADDDVEAFDHDDDAVESGAAVLTMPDGVPALSRGSNIANQLVEMWEQGGSQNGSSYSAMCLWTASSRAGKGYDSSTITCRAQQYCYVRFDHPLNVWRDNVTECTLNATDLKEKGKLLNKTDAKTWFQVAADLAAKRSGSTTTTPQAPNSN